MHDRGEGRGGTQLKISLCLLKILRSRLRNSPRVCVPFFFSFFFSSFALSKRGIFLFQIKQDKKIEEE
jgi:hypothetical protein